jgi:cell division protein FtsN
VIEARTPLRGGRISTGVIGSFLVAVVAALLVGGAGGYLVATASRTSSPPHETVVRQQAERQQTFLPSGIPTEKPQPTLPQQTTDPNGNVVHF